MKKQIHKRSLTKILIIVTSLPALCFLILFFIPYPFYKDGFKNLDLVITYANTTNENIQSDTDNTIKPDFSSYYKTLSPTWTKNIKDKINGLLMRMKLKQPPAWSPSFFKTQLEIIASEREKKGFKDNFICKLTPSLQSKIVIFGNVQGAFHSLTRCLQKLKELDIINNDLKVINPENFIIFMGDIISRSPYSMETLSLVMKLIQLNPDNVIYLKGNHETANYWQEHTLKTELQIRASRLDKATIPLADKVNQFFNTLPLAIYLTIPTDGTYQYIRMSDSGRGQNELLNEQNYSEFLTSKTTNAHACFNLQEKSTTNPQLEIKVIFKGEKKRETYQPHQGLRLLPPDMGSTAWSVLSCPTPVYQKAIKFMHDAFVIISPAKKLDNWKITLYNRNVQSQDPFKTTVYNLLSGIEDGKEIKEPKIEQTPEVSPKPITPKESGKSAQTTPPEQPSEVKTSSSLASQIEDISKDAQALAQHAQALADKLKQTTPAVAAPTTSPQESKKSESSEKITPEITSKQKEPPTAFEPLTPEAPST